MVYLNLGTAVRKGTIVEEILDKKPKDNKLTAIMPDADGRVWFTSKYGVVGVIDTIGEKTEEGCPKFTRLRSNCSPWKTRSDSSSLRESVREFRRLWGAPPLT
jgi:hypothetical protein